MLELPPHFFPLPPSPWHFHFVFEPSTMLTRSSDKQKATATPDPAFDAQKRLVRSELGDAIGLEDDSFICSLYHHVAPESAIDAFLKKSRFYSLAQRRWKIPRSCSKLIDKNFHTPFLHVFSSIVKHFYPSSTAQVEREVVDTHTIDLQHREASSVVHHSRPGLAIKAEGPSFQRPYTEPGQQKLKIGYSNIASCINIYVDGKEPSISDQLTRATIYARQIFIHQPNRRFVRTLVISEQYVRLFHLDRSGAQYTPPFDFHDDPRAFVRLVLGISSLNESDIGLDTSIQWTIRNGRKVGGILKAHSADGEDIAYELLATSPFFCDDSIRGRSTMCWSVRDPISNEDLVVKDSWRTEDRMSEHLFMQDAVGIPGVVQMVTCEPDRCDTKSLRRFDHSSPAGFRNRIETRVVMKAYGKSIRKYTSAKQLFCALRDAIAGHMELFKKGIIHRDVSLQNVLLGKPGAEPGNRGILIDFDISTLRSLKKPADGRLGTRSYVSVLALHSSRFPHPLPHDHLDDLESFLYALLHIMFAYDSSGAAHPADAILSHWEKNGDDLNWLGVLKEAYLARRFVPYPVKQRWPSPCVDLILAYAAFVRPLVQEKLALNELTPAERSDQEEAFASRYIQHYTHVLELEQKKLIRSELGGEISLDDDAFIRSLYHHVADNAVGNFLEAVPSCLTRILVLTERHARLFHFDRSGAQYAPVFNFHDDPHRFVRLVLGLSSLDESDIGLDSSIQYTIEDGRKVGGTLKVRGPDNQDALYTLAAPNPFFCDDSIRGRSTTCWSVRDPISNEYLVVGDSWRSKDRLSEHVFMQTAIGIPGVVQMVACEPDRCDTRSLRGFGDSLPAGFRNRIETRIVMKTYAKSIRKYTSPRQLFCALRDAIAGHMELFKRGTIHRDISLQNVLLGNPDAQPGYRGVLIDFDISTLRHLNTPVNRHMGTRPYLSVPALHSGSVSDPLPHDHLDELESFLYVLVHIMFEYDSEGAAHTPDEDFHDWEVYRDDCRRLGRLKQAYLTREYVARQVSKRWPSPCVDLIIAYAAFMRPLVLKKLKLSQLEPAVRNGREKVFAANLDEHYNHILNLFDTAIEALDHPDTWEVVDDSSDEGRSVRTQPEFSEEIIGRGFE
ncbi:hypothetical protein MD484_g6741, partial [Candolleomyces efflorescens]